MQTSSLKLHNVSHNQSLELAHLSVPPIHQWYPLCCAEFSQKSCLSSWYCPLHVTCLLSLIPLRDNWCLNVRLPPQYHCCCTTWRAAAGVLCSILEPVCTHNVCCGFGGDLLFGSGEIVLGCQGRICVFGLTVEFSWPVPIWGQDHAAQEASYCFHLFPKPSETDQKCLFQCSFICLRDIFYKYMSFKAEANNWNESSTITTMYLDH